MEKFIKTDCDLSFLNGCFIKQVGFVPRFEGGLAIDYIDLKNKEKRLVLGYNELGTWIEINSDIDSCISKIAKPILNTFKALECPENKDVDWNKLSFFKNGVSFNLVDKNNSKSKIFSFLKKDIEKLNDFLPYWTWDKFSDINTVCFFYTDLKMQLEKLNLEDNNE